MDLIILQYADDFDLYHANDRKGKEKSDYSPKDKDTDYFYLLKRSGNTLTWQAVIPNIDVERQKSLTYIQELARSSEWLNMKGKSGSIDITLWKSRKAYELEPGCFVSLITLLEDKRSNSSCCSKSL